MNQGLRRLLVLAAVVCSTTIASAQHDPPPSGGGHNPAGGGDPTFNGPAGGGEPGNPAAASHTPVCGVPNPPLPGAGGGSGSGGLGGGAIGGNRPPTSGGGFARGGGGSYGGGGKTTGGRSRPKTDPDRYQAWDIWWELNDDAFLKGRALVRASTATSAGSDAVLGSGDALPVAKITAADLRKEIAPAIRRATKDSFSATRREAAIALGKIADAGRPDLYESIRAVVADPEWEVRASACLALGLIGSAEAVPLLTSIMKNEASAKQFVGLGNRDFSVKERSFAAIGLALVGMDAGVDPATVEALVATAKASSPHPDVRAFPALALGAMHAYAASDELKKIAFDATAPEVVRAHAVVALGKLGDKSAVSLLAREGLVDRSAHVQRSSAIALGLLTDREDTRTVETLIQNAKSASDRAVRNFAMIALGQIGNRLGRDQLVQSLKHGSQHDRTFAAMGLAAFGFKNPESRNEVGKAILEVFLEAKSDAERAAFAIALGVVDYKPATEAVVKALAATTAPELRGHLATAAGLLGAKDATPILQDLVLHASDASLLMKAAVALGLMGDPSVTKTLLKVFEESSSNYASLAGAALALGFLGDRSAVGELTKTLAAKDAKSDYARTYAAMALGILADKREMRTLSAIQENCNYLAATEFLPELLSIY